MNEIERKEIEREVRKKALTRARAKLGFAWHAAVYALTNLALFAIARSYTPDSSWFVWPLAGWGAALGFHAFAVFQGAGLSDDLVEREVQRELRRRGLT